MPEALLGSETEVKQSPYRRYIALCSTFIILLGLFFVIYGSIDYRTEWTERKILNRVGVVIDAGGSGTRIIVYSYTNHTMKQLKYGVCEDKGLSNYNVSEFTELKKLLNDCLRDGATSLRNMTLSKQKEVPIYFAATAGMRLLKLRNKREYDDIWGLVKECLHESEFKVAKADTITGFEEAEWAWVAANYLKHTFVVAKAKYGTIDFGSSSLQLAFEPKGDVKSSLDVKTINIDGQRIKLYGHSYLCYGSNEMSRRFLAKLVKNANYARVVKNPCFFTGYSTNVSSDYLWKEPCSSGDYAKSYLGEDINGPSGKIYTIEGSSDFSQCYRLLNNLIRHKCTNRSGLCGMSGEFQPNLRGNFFALSTFYHIGKSLNLKPESGKYVYRQSAQTLCSSSWSSMIEGSKSTKYVDGKCFQAAYGYFLLANGFKFDKSTWNIEYTKKVDGTNVGWSLGLIYSNKENMYSTKLQYVRAIIEKPVLLVLIVLGPICIIIGVLLILKIYRVKTEGGDEDVV